MIARKTPILLLISFLSLNLSAQGSIDTDGGKVVIDFDNTTDGILNGAFTATEPNGIDPSPNVGQLDEDGVHFEDDLNDSSPPAAAFGSGTTTNNFFRGISDGTVGSSGVYAFDVDPGVGVNRALGIQPSGSRWGDIPENDGGHIVFRFVNNSGVTLTAFRIQYEIYVLNNASKNSVIEAYLTNDVTTPNYGSARDTYTTTAAADLTPTWVNTSSVDFTVTSGVDVADGDYIYLRFYIYDGPDGMETRDEFAIDDITITGASMPSLLPVELHAFTAKKKGNTVDLHWQTATETNNDYFIVQRSADGRHFDELSQITGAGTTTEPQEYQFRDRQPLAGTNYYRLLQVDYDGREQYHKVIAVKMDKGPSNWQIFPTLANEVLQLEWSGEGNDQGIIQILDSNGTIRKTFFKAESLARQQLDISDLTTGHYVVRIAGNEITTFKRFIKY